VLKIDVDWAENYTMLHAREIQSEYWMMKQCSIFVCIGKMLLKDVWAATSGQLKEGSEVTVELEGLQPFWASVKRVGAAEGSSEYVITDSDGVEHTVKRSDLRERVWHTTAQIGVSNDKRHDSYATQSFMTMMIEQWQQFEGGFSSLHVHSDNAGSHFKNSRTLNYLSRLKELLKMKVTWSFGCPGHGKGPWDGIGGMMKRALRADTIKGKVILKTYTAVAAHLETKFSDAWQEKHKVGTGYTINAVKVFVIDSSEIERNIHEVYDSVGGIRKSFGYMAMSNGRVLQRWFDCWCTACTAATGPEAGMAEVSSTSGYHVTDCKLPVPEPWWDCSVQLQGTRGIQAQKIVAQANARKMVAGLKPGTFVAVQDRTAQGREEHYLIGITIDCGDGGCIVKHCDEREYIEKTRFDPGDYAIAVRWLGRLAEDPQQRTFELAPESEEFIINSTELRFKDVELELVPPLGPVVRRSARPMSKAQSSKGRVLNRKYVIPAETEQAILNECTA
jgi:hypothetical protein